MEKLKKQEKEKKKKKMTIEEESENRIQNINLKLARDAFIKIYHKISIEDKLFKKNLEYEPTPFEINMSKKKSTFANKKIAKDILLLEGENILDKHFEENLRLELLKEINSADNLDWMLRKNETLKSMNLIKNLNTDY